MQTQDTPAEFLFKIWPWLEANKNRLIGGVVAAVVIAGIVYFVVEQRAQRQVAAGEALTSLMMNPTLATNNAQLASALDQFAAAYSGTEAAQRAQLQAAAALFQAGSYPEAQAQFEKLLNNHPNGPFAAMAELGVASSLEAQNKLDQAAAAYQRVLSMFSTSPYAAQAEFGLGRIAEQQGKLSDALTHYQNVLSKTGGGSLAQEAAMRGEDLQRKLAAASPKPAAAASKTPLALPPLAPHPSQPAPKPATAPVTPAKP